MGKVRGYGSYKHIARTPIKRPGRHAKSYSKRTSPRKQRYRGQGR